MRVFAYEHITGGGLIDEALSPSLVHEGEMILQALLQDLIAIPGIEVVTCRDPRLPVLELPVTTLTTPHEKPQAFQLFEHCLTCADAVWPVAPETGGMLEKLSQRILDEGCALLGSSPSAIQVAASKLQTARVLGRTGVPVVPTYAPDEDLPKDIIRGLAKKIDRWVVKPDDGLGCLGTRIFRRKEQALAWLRAEPNRRNFVLQPFVPGASCSLSLLCRDGCAWLLGSNQQCVEVRNDKFYYLGSVVNGICDVEGKLERLGKQVANVIPGLWGYVGIDLVMTDAGPVVLEVNPRLTTSYVGLHASLNYNPALLVLELLNGASPMHLQNLKPVKVEVNVG